MKVTAFIGSGRKRHSYNASEKFLQNLQSLKASQEVAAHATNRNPAPNRNFLFIGVLFAR